MTNNRKRINDAFAHREPDRTPVFEYVINSNEITKRILKRPASFLNWEECVKEKGWEKALKQYACDRIDIAVFLGHDMLYQVTSPRPPAKEEKRKEEEPAAIDDPVENLEKRNRLRREKGCSINQESMLIYDLLKEEMEKRDIDLPIMAPAYCHGVWTDIDLMQVMLLAPELAHEHFSLATKNAELLIDEYIKHGIDIFGIGGDFAGNTPLISPESYRTFIMPELKKLSGKIHSAGKLAVNASDGNLWSVIDDFLIGSGVDGYLEIDLHAGMELKKLKASFGNKITFLGNLDCGNTLSFATPEKVRESVIKCLEEGKGNGGHILTASNAITESVPVENYIAAVNAYKDYFSLEKIIL